MLSVLNLQSSPVYATLSSSWARCWVEGSTLLGQKLLVKDPRFGVCHVGKWSPAWVSPNPARLICGLKDHFRLDWDPTTNRTSRTDGVEVRVADGWDAFVLLGFDIYDDLTKRLAQLGYAKGQNLFPQPYDWRLSVADWEHDVFIDMRETIEHAVSATGQKVVLTGLSMAGPFTHAFLSFMRNADAEWSNFHVHAWVPVGAPWNGAVNALSALLGGAGVSVATPGLRFHDTRFKCDDCFPPLPDNFTVDRHSIFTRMVSPLVDVGVHLGEHVSNDLTSVIRTIPSMYWMSTGMDYSTSPPTDPHVVIMEHAAWVSDDVIEEHVRASKVPEVFRKLGLKHEADLLDYAMSVPTTDDPGVPVHCVYSHNVQTFTRIALPTTNEKGPTVHLGDGDGTVHLQGSLDICERWKSTVRSYKIPGVPHIAMMYVKQVADLVAAVATDDNTFLEQWTEPAFEELHVSVIPSSAFPRNFLITKETGQ